MTQGPRDLMRQALTAAGFTEAEADSLLGQWNKEIRPNMLNLLKVISEATKTAVENGADLTSQTLCVQFRRAIKSITRRRGNPGEANPRNNPPGAADPAPGPIRPRRRGRQLPAVPQPPAPLPLGNPIPVLVNPRGQNVGQQVDYSKYTTENM